MALINIEYGSLASSEIMNKNFIYLDDKIAESSESIMTSISSILSNIATINTRLNDISENMTNSIQNLSSTMEEYKTQTKLLVNKSSMAPDWINCSEITIESGKDYEITSNGYILFLAKSSNINTILINEKTIEFKLKNHSETYGPLCSLPVFEGDIISTTSQFNKIYFLPSKEVVLEEF